MTKKMFAVAGLLLLSLTACTTTKERIRQARPPIHSAEERVPEKPQSAIINTKINIVPTNGIVPSQLIIPSLGIRADVEPVTVTDGRMNVPPSTERVGYLSPGVLPGAAGNAVMDGHVDNYKGPAVFFRLKSLKKGEDVIVKDRKGCKIVFQVESVEVYKTNEAPIHKIFGNTFEPRLNLITCTGKYSRKKQEHEARLVVFAKRRGGMQGCNRT